MAKPNEAKVAKLVKHLQEGGDTDKESLTSAMGVGIATRNATIEAYLEAAGEVDEYLINLEVDGESPYTEYEGEDTGEGESEEESDESEEEGSEEDLEEEEPPAPKPTKPKKKAKDFRFFMKNKNGTDTEIEQVSTKGNIITFREKAVTQIVKLILGGEIVEVDIIPLRHQPPLEESEYGVTNAQLLALAVAAQ